METDADLRRDFKVIDEKMIDLPAQVEAVHANIESLKLSIIQQCHEDNARVMKQLSVDM